jgi:iron complex outermembrane recepter protein
MAIFLNAALRGGASVLALAAGGVLAPIAARAAVPASASSSGAAVVNEVIVTAQKREQSLQSVPLAISAYSAQARDKIGLTTAQDQLNFTPGVTYVPDVDRITIRGVGRTTTQLGTDNGVAVYQDGFYTGSSAGINASTLGTERVEILRGPQGTLWGRNSIGGAVNVISRRPDHEFTGDVRATYNSYNGESVEARVAGPITDWMRASAWFTQFDQTSGPYHDKLPNPTAGSTPGGPNGAGPLLNTATLQPVPPVRGNPNEGFGVGHGWTANFQVAVDFSPKFDGWFRFVTTDQFTRPRDSTGVSDWSLLPLIVPNVFTGFQPDQNPGITDHRAFYANRATSNHLHDDNQLIAELNWHGSGFDVKYIGGYWHYQNNNSIDGDATGDQNFRTGGLLDPAADLFNPALPAASAVIARNDVAYVTNDTQRSWSHEINITSTDNGPWQWLAGAYYYNEAHSQDFSVPNYNEPHLDMLTDNLFGTNPFVLPLINAIGLTPGVASGPISNPDDLLYYYQAILHTQSEAVFGQVDWRPNDQWHFTGGARWSADQKQGYERQDSITQIVLGDQAHLAVLNALLGGTWPTYGPNSPFAGQLVGDLVFEGCSGAGTVAAPPGVVPVNPSVANCPGQRHLKNSWSAPTGTAIVAYTPTPDTNLYASYTRGYKSGGYNLGTLSGGSLAFVDPEYIDSFEAGWKQNFGRKFQLNLATYYYLYHGLQALNGILAQASPPIIVNELVNLDQSRSIGVELETQWSPIDNLSILFNYSYSNSRITKACCFVDSSDPSAVQPGAKPVGAGGGQSLVGNTLPDAPEHKISANVNYTFHFAPGSLTLSATEDWHSDFYYALFNNPHWLTPGGAETDLRVQWTSASKRYDIIGTVTNLFDAEIPTSFQTLPPNQNFYQILALQPPRVFTAELRYHF